MAGMKKLELTSIGEGVLKRILWPVIGALTGFVLFFMLLVTGMLITADHLSDKAIDLLGVTVATFVAAWAGGWAAFQAERNTQESNRQASRISAANKAIFTVATAYSAYENLRQFCIDTDGIRNAPDRVLRMDSPQAGMMKNIGFNFDELSFFLDQPGETSSTILMELMMFEWQYQVLRQTVEDRARAFEELHTTLQANPVANMNLMFIQIKYPALYQKLEATTNQLVESVDTGIRASKEINQKIQHALQQQFPGQNFLQINFKEAGKLSSDGNGNK